MVLAGLSLFAMPVMGPDGTMMTVMQAMMMAMTPQPVVTPAPRSVVIIRPPVTPAPMTPTPGKHSLLMTAVLYLDTRILHL